MLVADERTEETFTVPASEMERFFYAFSTLHCLAVSMQDGGAGTGTVIRADTVRRYAADAGFSTRRRARRRTPAVPPLPVDLMMGDLVLVAAVDDGVATVTLNRPEKKNALSIALHDEVSDAFDTSGG